MSVYESSPVHHCSVQTRGGREGGRERREEDRRSRLLWIRGRYTVR